MIKTVYLHIGYPKCASTYLQDEIFPQLGNYSHMVRAPGPEKYYPYHRNFDPENFRKMVEKHMVARDETENHLLVSFEDWTELLFAEFEKELRKARDLPAADYVLSNRIVLENLKAAYPEAHIIIIIREQVSWIISRYIMLLRGAKTSKDIDAFLQDPLDGYDDLIERAQQLFGKDHVKVMPLEAMRQDQDGFLKELTEYIAPGSSITVSEKQVNIAPDLKREAIYRRMKRSLRLSLERKHLRPLYGIIRIVMECTVRPALYIRYRDTRSPKPEVTLTGEQRKRFAECNRKIEALTGLDLSRYGYILNP